MKKAFFFIFCLFCTCHLYAKVPKLLVVPHTDEALCTLLERQPYWQEATAALEQEFAKMGFEIVHFREAVRLIKDKNGCHKTQKITIENLLKISQADVYVVADVIPTSTTSGSYVRVALTVYNLRQQNRLAYAMCESAKFRTDDISKLIANALQTQKACRKHLLEQLNVYSLITEHTSYNPKETGFGASLRQPNSPTKIEEEILDEAYFTKSGISKQTFGKYHLLVIGVADYERKGIDQLKAPIRDGQKVIDTLVKYYAFEKENISFLKNPKRTDVLTKIDEMKGKLQESDNLLIFYAGHGYYNSQTDEGYWLPADAAAEPSTENWISNTEIRQKLHEFKSKHILVLVDACFSGSLLMRGLSKEVLSLKFFSMKSRKAMSSGSLNPVPDNSPFLKNLIQQWSEFGQKKQGESLVLPAYQLFNLVRMPTISEYPLTLPQYGSVRDTDDRGGEFIFLRK